MRLVNGNYAVSSDIGYRHKRELVMRVDARCNTLPNLFNVTLTNAALAFLTMQYMKFETMKHLVTVTEVSIDSFEVKYDDKVYTVSELFTRCTCSFYCNYCLPCSHVFSTREFKSVLHCDTALLDAIPKRWKKKTFNSALRVLPSSSQPSVKKQQIVKKVMYEQDRYLQARKVTVHCAIF